MGKENEKPPVDKNLKSKEEKGKEKEDKKLTQKQFDKALATRLQEETTKIEKEAEKTIKKAKDEQDKLAKLSAEEREVELKAKGERELNDKLTEVSKRENRLDAIEKFTEAKVPVGLVDYVISDDKATTLENTEKFIKTYNESVSKSVAEQLKGTPPKDLANNSKGKATDKEVVTSF